MRISHDDFALIAWVWHHRLLSGRSWGRQRFAHRL